MALELGESVRQNGFRRGSNERAELVASLIPQEEIVQAMTLVDPSMPQSHWETIVAGEVRRFLTLTGYHLRSYEMPLRLLMEHGVIERGYSLVELGPSFGVHWSKLEQDLQPGHVTGIDNQPHIVAGAKVAMVALQRRG